MTAHLMSMILFGVLSAVISGAFGLFIRDEPLKYCLINFPAILIFGWLMTFVKG